MIEEISTASRIVLYTLLVVKGLFAVLILYWQVNVLRGRAMNNPDGTVDDWHEQKTHYGIAVADVVWSVPLTLAGIVLALMSSRWGFYILALVSFWWVWANTMTTATSLRFEKPAITFAWLITFPFGIFIGLAYIAWTVLYFSAIYG
jgi:hypothetical protein